MSLRHQIVDTLLTGDGRIGRLPFLLGIGLLAGLALVVDQLPDEGGTGLVAMALRLPLLFSLACLLSQRLHDVGRAGWWIWPDLASGPARRRSTATARRPQDCRPSPARRLPETPTSGQRPPRPSSPELRGPPDWSPRARGCRTGRCRRSGSGPAPRSG